MIKTSAICLLGAAGLSTSLEAMQILGMGHHGVRVMTRVQPIMSHRQSHTSLNNAAWLCPIKESDIETLSKAGPKLGEHVQKIQKDVIGLHDLLKDTDSIDYNKALNWDEHLHNQFYYLHDLYDEIKNQRRAAQEAEEAAIKNVIEAFRISTDHLGHKLSGKSVKPIQTHSITQTEDAVTIDLNTKPIEDHGIWDHEIWNTNDFDWKNSKDLLILKIDIWLNFAGKLGLENYLLQSVDLIKLFLKKDTFVFTPRGFQEESNNLQANINISIFNHLKAEEKFSLKEIELIQNCRTGLKKMNEKKQKNKPSDIAFSKLASGITEEHIETLSKVDAQLGEYARHIKDYMVQLDEIVSKDEYKTRQESLKIQIEFARLHWAPYFLELAEKYPEAKKEFDHLEIDVLYIAYALERLTIISSSDTRNNWEHVENMRCNFEKNAHQLMQMGGFKKHGELVQLIHIVRELFDTYKLENGIRSSKE